MEFKLVKVEGKDKNVHSKRKSDNYIRQFCAS